MVDNKFNEAILQSEAKLEQTKQIAENMVEEFKNVATIYLAELCEFIVNRAITDNPDVVRNLGIEKLGELKYKISVVVQEFGNDINTRLDTKVVWAHRTSFDYEIDYSTSRNLVQKTNEMVDDAIREIIGKIGVLLIDYQLASEERNSVWRYTENRILRYSYGLPDYGSITYGKKLGELRERYNKIISEFCEAARILQKALLDKKVAEAKNLWNNA